MDETPQDPDPNTIPYAWLYSPPTDLTIWEKQLLAQSLADHFISAKRWLAGTMALRHLPYEQHKPAWDLLFAVARTKFFSWDSNRKVFVFSSYLKQKAEHASSKN